MVGRPRIALELILKGGTEDERTVPLRDRPARARAQTVALDGVEVVAVARREGRARTVLPRVEIAEI